VDQHNSSNEVAMTDARITVPVACTLERSDVAHRRARWQALLARAAGTAERIDRGVRVTLSHDAGVAEEVEALAELERECCAFADWTVEARGERVVLDVTADGEMAIASVQAMFVPFGAGSSV
jgi:hypothetical protein